jgi:glucose/arabinose dehydrogenase
MASREGRSAMREKFKFGMAAGIASYANRGDVMRTSFRRRLWLVAAAAGLVLVIAAPGSVAPTAANPTVTRVMGGLDNPRGLAFGPKGALYVAEAGRGG